MNRELGCAGHLIGASSCHFRRHTQIGTKFRVSTVGDYYVGEKRTPMGFGDQFFETMVFSTVAKSPDNDGCGCLEAKSWSEIDTRRYATAGEALAGHEELVRIYSKRRTK